MNKNDEGFTLIEIMVAVAIIAILAAIAIPSYLGIQKKSARAEARANLLSLSVALEGYQAENNTYGTVGSVFNYRVDGNGTVLVTFQHPGNLEQVANLGNQLNYDYQIRINGVSAYSIQAFPQRGAVANDNLQPTYDSNGVKGPPGFGW